MIEFPADDPERARRVWMELLGVELEVRHSGQGEGCQTHSEAPAVGVHTRGRRPDDSFSLPYFAVRDVAEALERVEALGGSVGSPGARVGDLQGLRGKPVRGAQRLSQGRTERCRFGTALCPARSRLDRLRSRRRRDRPALSSEEGRMPESDVDLIRATYESFGRGDIPA